MVARKAGAGYTADLPGPGWDSMFLRHHLRRKLLVTVAAALALAFLYEVTTLDSRYAARQAEMRESTAAPAPGARLRFVATAYCKGTTTASGVQVRTGIAAADPDLLPVGSVIQIDNLPEKYNGIYTIMDTGPAVQGRKIDVYMWSCYEALSFGRRSILLTVLRLGWNPVASERGVVNRLFRQREANAPLPSRNIGVPTDTTPVAPPASSRPD
jgi:3D (Asp-Asp-Asp) domain-containing protein